MTRIQSRPVPDKNWEYRFYVEFEGRANQPGVVNALSGINAEALKYWENIGKLLKKRIAYAFKCFA